VGEPGRSSDATQCRVGPGERRAKEGAAGLIGHGWRDVGGWRSERLSMGEQHCGERRHRKCRPVRERSRVSRMRRTPVHGSTGRTAARQDAEASRA
jgi:hypothetical protein